MKKSICMLCAVAFSAFCVEAADFRISGISDTTFTLNAPSEEGSGFLYGIESYANLRFQSNISDYGTFYGAFNVIAIAGSGLETAKLITQAKSATVFAYSSLTINDNYAAGIELERLYVRLNSDYLDLDVGLFRLAFGYGQVFGPSDFLSHRNPLFPDARVQALLGASVAIYPGDAKVLAFAFPQEPFNSGGEGFRFGLSVENHWDWGSLQGLYAFQTPKQCSHGIHRFGLSLKADLELGFVADMLYTYNQKSPDVQGLSFSAGFDYSFLDGKLYILSEYLFNGQGSATAFSTDNIYGFSNRHYIYALVNYRINDYTATALAYLAGLSDGSSVPILSFDHDLFQGCTLSLSGRFPLDQDVFLHNDKKGEFGPSLTGSVFSLTTKLKIRL